MQFPDMAEAVNISDPSHRLAQAFVQMVYAEDKANKSVARANIQSAVFWLIYLLKVSDCQPTFIAVLISDAGICIYW